MTGLIHDLHYSLRLIRRHPGYSIAVLLTLALAIGATTTIYTLVDRIVLTLRSDEGHCQMCG